LTLIALTTTRDAPLAPGPPPEFDSPIIGKEKPWTTMTGR
jgi:hypothetical protein